MGNTKFLINNAGIEDGFLVKDQSYEDYKKLLELIWMLLFMFQICLPLFKINNGGES